MFKLVSSLLCLMAIYAPLSYAKPKQCTYSTYKWNTLARKVVEYQQVHKDYNALMEEEIDPQTGCSVCEEDQTLVHIPTLKPFKVCKRLAKEIELTLLYAIDQGQAISQVVAYRVGKTKGKVDKQGNRTLFSHHSFGSAIDINSAHNGLYDMCTTFGPHCRLIKGGAWNAKSPLSLTEDSPVVRLMGRIGFKWGGHIRGRQKDFMHFSLSGY